jgi:hypothetical protein
LQRIKEYGEYKQTTLCIIHQRRATESDYGLIIKKTTNLEFETEQGARKWASANIEAKKNMIVSWSIKAEVTNADK